MKMCMNSHEMSRKFQINVRYTGHGKIVGPSQCYTYVSPFWPEEVGGGS